MISFFLRGQSFLAIDTSTAVACFQVSFNSLEIRARSKAHVPHSQNFGAVHAHCSPKLTEKHCLSPISEILVFKDYLRDSRKDFQCVYVACLNVAVILNATFDPAELTNVGFVDFHRGECKVRSA